MPTFKELRQFAATPLCRYEKRVAAGGRSRLLIYAFAGLLDAAAVWVLLYVCVSAFSSDSGWTSPGNGGVIGWAALILGILAILPMMSSIGLSASAIAGERENGTMEALLLAPLDRRTLLWAKLLGRTAPPRRFMLATVPAYLCSAAVVAIYVFPRDARPGGHAGLFWAVAVLFLLLVVVATALVWGVLFYQVHAVAAVGLWFSSKYRRSWTATLLTYLAVLGPTVVLVGVGGILSLVWPMVLGPALFSELVALFDERALGPEGLD